MTHLVALVALVALLAASSAHACNKDKAKAQAAAESATVNVDDVATDTAQPLQPEPLPVAGGAPRAEAHASAGGGTAAPTQRTFQQSASGGNAFSRSTATTKTGGGFF